MNSIWFDVTTIHKWRRPPVGIVRVQIECFKYLAGLSSEQIKFCRFDKKVGAFFELSADDVREALKQHSIGQAQPPPPKAARRFVDSTKRAIEVVPPLIRDPVLQFGRKTKPLLRTTLHNYRLAAVRVKNVSNHLGQMLRKPETVEISDLASAAARFRRGDVLISSGLDWDEKDLELQYRLKRDNGLKQIHFCHDLIPVKRPQMCVGEVAGLFSQYFVNLAWCSDEVLCVSKSSERDLHKMLGEVGAPQPPTRIVTLGAKIPSDAPAPKTELVDGKYLLFVSTVERRKNHEVLYRAMALLAEEGRTDLPKLVFVGMFGWGVHDLMNDLRFDYRVRDRIVMLHNVSDAELSALYRGAEFTLYPSHYEGWGLPLAESLAHGKFCLSSNTSSLPEVAGDLVEYIDPWETRRWAERIAYYCDHPEEVAKREAIIRARYKAPSWEDTGKTVYQAALDVIARGEVPARGRPSA